LKNATSTNFVLGVSGWVQEKGSGAVLPLTF